MYFTISVYSGCRNLRFLTSNLRTVLKLEEIEN
jgi:hypothetical protein